jgi:hypothetical protein
MATVSNVLRSRSVKSRALAQFQNCPARCHPEPGDSRARDLTLADAVDAVDGNARASCSAGVPRPLHNDVRSPLAPTIVLNAPRWDDIPQSFVRARFLRISEI